MGTTRRSSGAARTGATDEATGHSGDRRSTTRARPKAGHGLFWGAVFTLAPYLLGLLGVLVWALPNQVDGALFLAAASAPYAALGTGAAWVLVLAMQYGPAKRWRGTFQGLLAAAAVYVIAAAVVLIVR